MANFRTLKELSRAEIREIAQEYGNSGETLTASHFSEIYNISENTFYRLLKNAIVRHIVDEKTCLAIAAKSEANSERRGGRGAKRRTCQYYARLFAERNSFEFSPKEAKSVTEEYSESSLNKQEFVKENAMSRVLFDRTIISAISKNLVDDETFKSLKRKAEEANPNNIEKIEHLFEKLEQRRNMP